MAGNSGAIAFDKCKRLSLQTEKDMIKTQILPRNMPIIILLMVSPNGAIKEGHFINITNSTKQK